MITQDGKSLEPVFGAGLTGLRNMGNTCYMASTIQPVFSFREFQEKYQLIASEHPDACHEDPAQCFHCQMGKLSNGLLSGRYSVPEAAREGSDEKAEVRGQTGIAPGMFKGVVGKGHPEFSTMRQQDALEFFEHWMTMIDQRERTSGWSPADTFKFNTQQRLACLQCGGARYRTERTNYVSLPISITPEMEQALDVEEQRQAQRETERAAKQASKDGKAAVAAVTADKTMDQLKSDGLRDHEAPSVPAVAFDTCWQDYVAEEVVEFRCPQCETTCQATKGYRIATFPSVLVVHMRRFHLRNMVQHKLSTSL